MMLSLLTPCFVCVVVASASTTVDPPFADPVTGHSSPMELTPSPSPEDRQATSRSVPSSAEIEAALRVVIATCGVRPVAPVTTHPDVPKIPAVPPAEDLSTTNPPGARQLAKLGNTTAAPTSWFDELPVVRKSVIVKSLAPGPHDPPVNVSSKAPLVGEFRTRMLPLEGPVDVVLVTHEYAEDYLASLGPRTRRMVEIQMNEDMASSGHTPLLEYDSEMVLDDNDNFRKLVVGDVVARTSEAMVFAIKSHPELLIKYQADCSSLDENDLIHPLVRDSWFLRKLDALNITPKVYALSPPTWLSLLVTPKTNFFMSRRRRAEYAGKCTVRYLLMDRAGQSVYSFVSEGIKALRPPSLLMALSVMKETLKGLKRIHALGIIHGDIHAGNILIQDMGSSGKSIKFIDFGKGFIAEQMRGKPANVSAPFAFSHPLFSHWDVLGFRSSYRDDVFKALWLGSFIMNGPALNQYVEWLANPRMVMAFKRDAYWFDVPGRRSLLESIPFGIRQPVKQGLQHVLDLIRRVDNIDAMPNHDAMIAQLRLIIELVKRHQ